MTDCECRIYFHQIMNNEPYWELETPVDALNRNVRLRYYRQAGRLQGQMDSV
jgi:hypothetical protein